VASCCEEASEAPSTVASADDALPPDELPDPDPELDPPDSPELDPPELLDAFDPELELLVAPTASNGEFSPGESTDPPLAQWTRNVATRTAPARIRVNGMLRESLSPQSGPAEFDAIVGVRTLDRPWSP
jgi:hypothetical protein